MLTHILVGKGSVCSCVDKEDCLPNVLAEGDGSTLIQGFCLVPINGTVYICFTRLREGNTPAGYK